MILAISYLNVGTQGFKNFKFGNFGKALGAAALFSILTEALQLLVPWRHGDFMDLAANILGVGLAGIMLKTMHSLKKKRSNRLSLLSLIIFHFQYRID